MKGLSPLPAFAPLAIVLLATGGVLHAVGKSANYMGYIGDGPETTIKLIALFFLFAPAVYATRHSLDRPIVKWLVLLGVGCELLHLTLDIVDDTTLNTVFLFDNANPVHIIAQEIFHASALALLLSALYYFVISHQAGEASLARERDQLQNEVKERVQAEAALEKSEAMFRTLVQGTSDAFLILEADSTVRYASDSIRHISGHNPGRTLVGRRFLDFILPEERGTAQKAFNPTDLPSGTSRQFEVHGFGDQTRARTLELVVTNLLETPPIEGMVVHARDVTERRTLEEQLRRSQKLDSLGTLAGGIAHDFNNLLTRILVRCELLLEHDQCEGEVRKEIKLLHATAERGAALVRKILTFSRQQPTKAQVLELNAVVAEVDRLMRGVLGEDVAIELQLAENAGNVRMDPVHLEQVITNLIANARDAMPTGGRLTVSTSATQIDEVYTRVLPNLKQGSYAVLGVTDSGHGMTPDIQSRIFEPFFTTKDAKSGTGLGLSTVYGIVRQADGDIHVYSNPGFGTTFKVFLPQVKGEFVDKAVSGERVGALGGDETILLVEDEEEVRSLVLGILRKHGYRVLDVDSPAKAVDVCKAHDGPIHLLLSDVVMPGVSGPEVARNVLAHQPSIKVLFMSGYPFDVISRHGGHYADAVHIEKPFTSRELLETVRLALQGR